MFHFEMKQLPQFHNFLPGRDCTLADHENLRVFELVGPLRQRTNPWPSEGNHYSSEMPENKRIRMYSDPIGIIVHTFKINAGEY